MTATRPDEEPQILPRRPNRRRLWWALGIFSALCIAWAAVIVYSDAEPPDLSDLALVPVPVADAENFYLALVKRGDAIKAAPIIRADEPEEAPMPAPGTATGPDAPVTAGETSGDAAGNPLLGVDPTEPGKPLRERLLEGAPWTPAQLARWLPALDALDAECREIAKLEKAQGSIPRTLAEIVPAGSIRELLQQLRLAAWARYHSGRQADALASALLGLDTGRRLADARGSLIDYLTALAIQGLFQTILHDFAARDDVDRATLDALLAGLTARETGTDAYAHSLRNEAQSGIRFLHSLTASVAATPGLLSDHAFDPIVIVAKTRVLYPLFYKPNFTVALYAEHVREQIRIYDLPLDERTARSQKFDWDLINARSLLKPYNLFGRIFLGILTPSFDAVASTRHATFSRQSSLITFVALRLYHLDHGTLPATLDELVPAYLPKVPIDYVDRQPIRYSRDARVVWSVGKKKLRITAADQDIDKREVFYRLDFATPPAVPGEPTAPPVPGEDTAPANP